MTQQEQIDYAAAHIIAYLDLINKGEHSDFKSAFNRESDLASLSDTQSYIVEDPISFRNVCLLLIVFFLVKRKINSAARIHFH